MQFPLSGTPSTLVLLDQSFNNITEDC